MPRRVSREGKALYSITDPDMLLLVIIVVTESHRKHKPRETHGSPK